MSADINDARTIARRLMDAIETGQVTSVIVLRSDGDRDTVDLWWSEDSDLDHIQVMLFDAMEYVRYSRYRRRRNHERKD